MEHQVSSHIQDQVLVPRTCACTAGLTHQLPFSSPSHYIQKRPILDAEARTLIVSAFRFAVERERIYLRAFVVMPDHWHALFALCQPWTLPKFMHDMMSFVGRETHRLLTTHGINWQDGYYDTHAKTAKQFEYIAYYIEQNPVVKGLVGLPEQWDASSASCKTAIADPWPLIYD